MAAKKFADYAPTKQRPPFQCRICRAQTGGRVNISLFKREPTASRATQYQGVSSISAAFCEQHAIEIFEYLKKLMEERL